MQVKHTGWPMTHQRCNLRRFGADTRTPEQKEAIAKLIKELCAKYQIVEVLGHRDTSPDLDGDGIVEPEEWTKMCPCFDVRTEYPFIPEIVVKP